MLGLSRNNTKTKCSTPAARAASTSASWPCLSTVSIESPACLDNVDEAVEITDCMPAHARARDGGVFEVAFAELNAADSRDLRAWPDPTVGRISPRT